jgi:N utilization substance protein B
MNRTELREQVFKLLFRVEFNPMEDMEEQEELFTTTSDTEFSEKDAEYIRDKYEKIADKLTEIDEAINKETTGWNTSRIAKVDLTIIRLAIYEIRYDDSVPTGVAINEAVELAKKFGQDGSPAFVNGVLAKFAQRIYRLTGQCISQKYVFAGLPA